MKLNFKNIKVIPAEKEKTSHKKSIWKIFNQNIRYNLITTDPVSYEKHCKWWETAHEKEYIYVILYNSEVIGYIRLTKSRTKSKEANEISIAIAKQYQNSGIGSHAYKSFENIMKKLGIEKIIALTDNRNEVGKKFFEKNNFKKAYVKYVKKL